MNRALLIIDVQNDYFDGGKCELHQPLMAVNVIKQLLEYFREEGLPVYYIQHISQQRVGLFAPDTEGVAIHNDIKPLEGERVITKHHPNSFFETELEAELHKNSIEELVVCGMMTHMCVDTTVRAAKDLGYQITLIEDACATRELIWKGSSIPANLVQSVYMASINQMFANVMTGAEFLGSLFIR